MSLPPSATGLALRFETRPGATPVVSVDGVWGAEGLHLSHWPGNRTPRGLKRDLSTGIALEFARLPESERAALTAGCDAVAINHYDTDGVCALFAVLHPERALRHEALLLDAAAAGDRFHVPSAAGFRLDAALQNLARPERSPLGDAVLGLPTPARHERLVHEALAFLGRVLEDGLDAHSALWAPEEAALEADRADLAAAALFDDLVHLDLAVWTSAPGRGSSRANAPDPGGHVVFDPGRHALFSAAGADRVLALGPSPAGTTARLVIGTGSFFDLPGGPGSARPDLAALAARLNEREGAAAAGQWHAQDVRGASPELWFGAEGLPLYVEHADRYLARSAQDPEAIKAAVLDAVRDAWALPQDDDEPDDDEDIFAV